MIRTSRWRAHGFRVALLRARPRDFSRFVALRGKQKSGARVSSTRPGCFADGLSGFGAGLVVPAEGDFGGGGPDVGGCAVPEAETVAAGLGFCHLCSITTHQGEGAIA